MKQMVQDIYLKRTMKHKINTNPELIVKIKFKKTIKIEDDKTTRVHIFEKQRAKIRW